MCDVARLGEGLDMWLEGLCVGNPVVDEGGRALPDSTASPGSRMAVRWWMATVTSRLSGRGRGLNRTVNVGSRALG